MDSVFPSAIILSEQPLIWLAGAAANRLLYIVKFRETIPKPKLKALFVTISKGSLQQESIDALKKSAQYFEFRYDEGIIAAK